MDRRKFLIASTAAGLTFSPVARALGERRNYPPEANGMAYEVTKTEAEWRAMLTDTQFQILRQEATERRFTSPLNDEKRLGLYHCAGCDLPVYSSATKYDSDSGWPSFWDNIDDAVRTKPDNSFFSTRTEVHCRRCGGHLGHIFEDGPEPTGLRHCLNGAALVFKPDNAQG